MRRRDMLRSLVCGAVGVGLVASGGGLKPCPMCGAGPEEVQVRDWMNPHGRRYWGVVCMRCRSETTIPRQSRAEAVAAWNRRA